LRAGAGADAEFNIVSVTCALGRQLLAEHVAAGKSMVTRSASTPR